MNEFQQTFQLSMLSNTAPELQNFKLSGSLPPQVELENAIVSQFTAQLASLALSFNVAWGPCVYVAPKDMKENSDGTYNATATNTVVVFNSGTQYVTAIAGTKPSSTFDVITEDGESGALVDWSYGSPSGSRPRISKGTGVAMDILLNTLKDPSKGSIASFFQNLQGSNITVTFTGHSLGGALAPALALSLFGASTNAAPGLPAKGFTAQVYATAGPDVGNKDYVNYYWATFTQPTSKPAIPWQQYNCKIWNSNDVVPHAWSKEFISQVAAIYQNNGMDTPAYVNDMIDLLLTKIRVNNPLGNPYEAMDPNLFGQFEGAFVPLTSFPASSSITYDCASGSCSANLDVCNFVTEMLYQHIDNYFVSFGLPVPAPHTKISACAVTKELDPLNINESAQSEAQL